MNMRTVTTLVILSVLLAGGIPLTQGNSSGKHNSGSSGCNCHGGTSGAISGTHNFPAEYDPSTASYSITVGFSGGIGGSGGGFSLQVSSGTLSTPGSFCYRPTRNYKLFHKSRKAKYD